MRPMLFALPRTRVIAIADHRVQLRLAARSRFEVELSQPTEASRRHSQFPLRRRITIGGSPPKNCPVFRSA